MKKLNTAATQSYRGIVDEVAGLAEEPTAKFDVTDGLRSMGLLFVLFFLIAPIILLTVRFNPIIMVAVIVAVSGMVYASYLFYISSVFEGLIAAYVFFAPFNLRLPLFDAPGRAHGYILLFDLAMLPLLALLLSWQRANGFDVFALRYNKLVCGSVFLLVGWTWFTVLFGAGPSQISMVAWALEQTRYGLVFLTALLAARYVRLGSAILLSVVSVASQVGFSVVQTFNGESPDRLYFLGSQIGGQITTINVFGWGFDVGLYAGGFVGSSRDLAVLVLLTVPAAIYFISVEQRYTVPCLLFIALGATQIAFSYSMSIFGSLFVFLTLLFLIVLLRVRSVHSKAIFRTFGSLLIMPVVLAGVYANTVLSRATILLHPVTPLIPKPGTGSDNTEPSSNEPPGETSSTDGTASTPVDSSVESKSTPSTRELKESERIVVEFVDKLPLISADTLPIRITQYDAAIRMALDFPLFGVGGYNFELLSKEYDGFRQLDAVHNTFLAYLTGNGVPGLMLYFTSVLLVLGSAIHKLSTDSTNQTLVLFIGAGMVAFHAASFWTLLYTTSGTYVMFWLIAGLVVGSE